MQSSLPFAAMTNTHTPTAALACNVQLQVFVCHTGVTLVQTSYVAFKASLDKQVISGKKVNGTEITDMVNTRVLSVSNQDRNNRKLTKTWFKKKKKLFSNKINHQLTLWANNKPGPTGGMALL